MKGMDEVHLGGFSHRALGEQLLTRTFWPPGACSACVAGAKREGSNNTIAETKAKLKQNASVREI